MNIENKIELIKNIKLNSLSVREYLESETYDYAEGIRNYEKYLNFVLKIFENISFTESYTKDNLISDIEAFYKAIV